MAPPFTRPLLRITIVIPLTPFAAFVYTNGVIKKLEDDFGGATYSRLPETQDERSPFTGTWFKEIGQATVAYTEPVFMLIADVDLNANRAKTDFNSQDMEVHTKDDLVRYLKTFKEQAQGVLGQEIIWITVQDLDQIV